MTAADLTGYLGLSRELGGALTIVFVFNGIVRKPDGGALPSNGCFGTAPCYPPPSHHAGLGLWHPPLFFIVDTFRGFSPLEMVGWVFGLGSGSFVWTWLLRGTGGGVLLVFLWHTACNFTTVTPVAALVTSMLVLPAALFLVVVAILDHYRSRVDDPCPCETGSRSVGENLDQARGQQVVRAFS